MSNAFEDYSLELIYQWDLVDIKKGDKTILSPMLQFCGAQSFRVGVKIENKEASLFFLETNLNKMGLKVVHVLVREESSSMEPYNHDPNSEEINCCTLWRMEDLSRLKNNRSFTFHIYIAGIVNGYRVQRLDSHLTENFKTSALYSLKDFADFEIINRGVNFPVHKFILAARSPVFATLIRDRANWRHNDGMDSAKLEIDCVDSATVDQFLRFLYTGELVGSINNSSQLLQLATAYQIKTLQDLCVAASSSITRDQMAEMALTLVKSESNKPSTEIRPDTIKPEVNFLSSAVILQYVWNLEWTEFDNITNSSEAFHYHGEPMFRAKIRKSGEIQSSLSSEQEFTLTFLSFNHNQIGCKIDEVLYCRDWQDHDWSTPTRMLERRTNHESILQTFAYTDDYGSRFNLKFYVKMGSTVTNFGYRIADTLWKDQLWTAAVEKQFTDVEFLVGDKSLGAHRFLLSAVSPVFAAMFQSGMEEALTGKVRIGDVDPGTFKHFLEFLYTGKVETAAKKEELLAVADKYQVETLVHLCQLATEPENMEDITEAFFAC